MKKILSMVLAIACLLSCMSISVFAKTMYAPDGRTISVSSEEVSLWKSVGWYTVPVMKIYAPNGKTAVIAKSDFDAWKAVGWYKEPVMKVYAPSGKSIVIPTMSFASWYSVGWSHSRSYRSVAVHLTDSKPLYRNNVIVWNGSEMTTNVGTTVLNAIRPSVDTWSSSDKKDFAENGAEVEYYLGGKYVLLSGTVAIRQFNGTIEDSMKVQILADDKVLYTSEKMTYKSEPIPFAVNVSGYKYLKIKFIPTSNSEDLAYDADSFAIGDLILYK